MSRIRSWRSSRPSPAMVVALIALFAALGGTATALRGKNSVRSDDLAPRSVRSSDIAPKAVKSSDIGRNAVKSGDIAGDAVGPFKSSLTSTAFAPGQVSTTSPVAVGLGGPTATVNVPNGALVAVYAEADMLISGGGADARGRVHLIELSELPTAPVIMETASGQVQTRRTAPGGASAGVVGASRAGWLVMELAPGQHVFQLVYSRTGGGSAVFANRKLWVTVIG